MFERENLKRVNFNVEPTKWEDFKIIKFDHGSRNIFMRTVKNNQTFALIDHFLKMLGFLRF